MNVPGPNLGHWQAAMNQKTLPLLTFALGLLLMRWFTRENHTQTDVDLVARLRQAGAL